MELINEFRDEYYFLSNFYDCTVLYEGILYKSSEAAFQAQKCSSEEEKQKFSAYDPDQAKHHGKRVKPFDSAAWNEKRMKVMYNVVYAKFTQHPDLAQKLIDTGDAILEEGNSWNDLYWGVDAKTRQGSNHLGRILMRIRKELKEQ